MSASSTSDPQWIRHEAKATVGVFANFFRTAVAFTRRPGAFAAEFAAGRSRAQNPLNFLATSSAIVACAGLLGNSLVGRDDGGSGLWEEIGKALGPYVYFAALGLITHALLRLRGSVRPLRSSIAMALFAGGGPAAAFSLLGTTMRVAVKLTVGDPNDPSLVQGLPPVLVVAMGVVFAASLLAYLVIFALAMAGLHGVTRRWGGLAVLGAFVACAFIAGAFHYHWRLSLPLHTPHPAIWFDYNAWRADIFG
jgi:hypothetical protein